MANNRMYLKCSCGETCYIGKRMGDGYYLGYGVGQRLPEIGPFFDAHEWCPGGLDHFAIHYESPPNYDHGPAFCMQCGCFHHTDAESCG